MNNKRASNTHIRWFDEIGIEDVPLVGGKNASLGEMYRQLAPKGVAVPNGFAITADAYRYFLRESGVDRALREVLEGLDTRDIENLRQRGRGARDLILEAAFPQDLQRAMVAAYEELSKGSSHPLDVAVRSSATAEDLPDASFAGQQESYLNVQGSQALLETCKRCFASLYTDRAISYRVDKGFDHFKVGLSIGVQRMVRSDLAVSGVMFSIDTETGFRDAVLINAAYGLGENVVQGSVNPDEYYVFKPTLKQGFRPIIQKLVGTKEFKLIYDIGGGKMTKNVPVPPEDRHRFAISDDEILKLARWACLIEDHYTARRGQPTPMDMEWAKDGRTGELFIVQARPETVQSQKRPETIEVYRLQDQGPGARHWPERRRENRPGSRARDQTGAGPAPVPRRRCARHRQDRSRLGADHEKGRCHRHESRRPDLPRGHRQPRTGSARRRRHRTRHRAASRRTGRHGLWRRGRYRVRLRRPARLRRRSSGPAQTGTPQNQDHDERRQSRGSVPALVCPQRRRRPGPRGIHHLHVHQGPSDGLARLSANWTIARCGPKSIG